MTERVIGPTGSKRRRRFMVGPLLLIAAFALMFTAGAQAVHDEGIFELEGNAVLDGTDGATNLPDDWAEICELEGVTGCETEDGTADSPTGVVFTGEGVGETIFAGGGSKDFEDIPSWKWKNGSVPDKDELLHGFAARYSKGGESFLYFGADRFDNSGDAQIGFWFLQDEVAPTGSGAGGGSPFSGEHTIGDVLVLSDFTGGGTTPTITIYEWNPDHVPASELEKGTLLKLGGGPEASAECGIAANDDFCAITNDVDGVFAPWPYLNKSGQNTFGEGEFYEGGINLTALDPDLTAECFASFVVETRSSQETTAVLKDFIGGQFERCDTSVTTQVSSTSIVLGNSLTDTATVEGTGGGTPTGTVKFFVCKLSAVITDCSTGGDPVPAAGTPVTLDPVLGEPTKASATSVAYTPTSIGNYCWRAEYTPAAGSPYSAGADDGTNECFTVTDIASTATAQSWLPQDTATITTTGGSVVAGSVTFTLYESADCTGTAVQTFPDRPVSATAPYTASTNNATYYTDNVTVSWKAVFTSSNSVASGDPSHCETSSIANLDNNIDD